MPEVAFRCSTSGTTSTRLIEHEPLLLAGLRSGVPLPYECATGTCGTCVARVVQGDCYPLWKDAPGAKSAKFSEENRILLCQTSAHGDCVVELDRPHSSISRLPSCDHANGVIEGVTSIAPDLFYVVIRIDRHLDYLPGQFFLIGSTEIEGYRAYSISGFDPQNRLAEFIVRRCLGGKMSCALTNVEAIGMDLKVFGPLGAACLFADDDADISVVVGGSGVAIALSILPAAIARRARGNARTSIYFGINSEKCDWILRRLEALSAASPEKIDVHVSFPEKAEIDMEAIGKYDLNFYRGLVPDIAVKGMSDRSLKPLTFIAGPPAMVDATIRGLLSKLRLSPRQIRYDKFS